ncbi:MAG: hypothetical protein IJR85_03760 [Synergistaceae bacterium]|nr:hypothetical protein [Synergistaceae bacterium]
MAITTTLNKVSVSLKLNNGTSAQGTTKTISISLGSLNKDTFNADKAMAIVELLEPCLDKALVRTEKSEVSILTDDE